jgi:hypothetical protein
MKRDLPPRARLEHLKGQAKQLLKELKSGQAEAIARLRESAPRLSKSSASDATTAKLSDAQRVVAREYGFASWPALKKHVEASAAAGETGNPLEQIHKAFGVDDAAQVREILNREPALKARINEPIGPFDSPAVVLARSRRMLDVLLEAGADINARSRWWAGGFGLLDSADPELAKYAIRRGAVVDVHSAARLGMMDRLRELIAGDPQLVHARGGDGQTPLHFAGTVDAAQFLLDHGADIDARDVDHESTPAQYMVRDRPEVARHLVRRGCATDILMAAALGDADLVRRHLDADPACVRTRVNDEFFPKSNPHSGGTIYQWTLGFHLSAHGVARQFGHEDVFQLLMQRSPADLRLVEACWSSDETAVSTLLRDHPDLAAQLSDAYRRHVADAARNNNTAAVRLMLAAGLPVDARGQHNGTPLHWAAYHGNAEMARAILAYKPSLEDADNDFNSTPVGWATHGSEHGWYCKTGDYAGTVEALLAAGAKPPDVPRGTEAVRAVLARA